MVVLEGFPGREGVCLHHFGGCAVAVRGDVLGCGYDVQSGRRCLADVAFSAGTCVSGELSTCGG